MCQRTKKVVHRLLVEAYRRANSILFLCTIRQATKKYSCARREPRMNTSLTKNSTKHVLPRTSLGQWKAELDIFRMSRQLSNNSRPHPLQRSRGERCFGILQNRTLRSGKQLRTSPKGTPSDVCFCKKQNFVTFRLLFPAMTEHFHLAYRINIARLQGRLQKKQN